MREAFDIGDQVEVKVGGSMGRWVPARVLDAATPNVNPLLGTMYVVELEGGRRHNFPENAVRRPRRVEPVARAPLPRARRPRAARARNPREPLLLPKYRAWIRAQLCIFHRLRADDPHHHGPRGMGTKAHDTYCVPVCRRCHEAVEEHRLRDLPMPFESRLELDHYIARQQVRLLTAYLAEHGGRIE